MMFTYLCIYKYMYSIHVYTCIHACTYICAETRLDASVRERRGPLYRNFPRALADMIPGRKLMSLITPVTRSQLI